VVLYREPSIRLDQPPLATPYSPTVPMDAEKIRQRVPNIPFRVLIVGRANAGKTSILQRVCETTESPVIYRGQDWQREEVRGPKYPSAGLISLLTDQVKLDPSVNVSNNGTLLRLLLVNRRASGASTRSTTNLFSPIIRVMSFTIPGE
jgi:GTPase SAR1 family protein